MSLRGLSLVVGCVLLAGCGGEPPPAMTVEFGDGGTMAPPQEQAAPKTLQAALGEVGACMRMDDFVGTSLYRLYTATTLKPQVQECGSCHANGEGGAWISDDVQAMFDGNRTFPGIMRLVTGTVDERGNFKDLVPSNRYIDKGVEGCAPDVANCHFSFSLTPEMQAAVLDFTERTVERWHAGECEPKPDSK